MDITKRLIELQQSFGWSDYKIAKQAGLSPNTVSNVYRRGNTPSLETLQAICNAFGMTLGQFFAEGELIELTEDLRELVRQWLLLDDDEKRAVMLQIQVLNKRKHHKP